MGINLFHVYCWGWQQKLVCSGKSGKSSLRNTMQPCTLKWYPYFETVWNRGDDPSRFFHCDLRIDFWNNINLCRFGLKTGRNSRSRSRESIRVAISKKSESEFWSQIRNSLGVWGEVEESTNWLRRVDMSESYIQESWSQSRRESLITAKNRLSLRNI